MTDDTANIPPDEEVTTPAEIEPLPERELEWKDLLTAVGIIWAIELVLGGMTAFIMLVASGFQPQSMMFRLEYLLPPLVFSWSGTLIVLWYFACRKYRRPITRAFAVRAITRETALYCVIAGALTAVLAGVLIHSFGNDQGYIIDLALKPPQEEGGEPSISLFFLLLVFVLPPFEEIYYRGFVYPALRRLAGVPAAFIVVVLWFGLVHTPQLFGNWSAVVVVTAVGALYTYLRQHYDSIFPSMITHFTYNAVLIVFDMVVSFFR